MSNITKIKNDNGTHQFEGLYQAGLITNIALCSFGLLINGIYILMMLPLLLIAPAGAAAIGVASFVLMTFASLVTVVLEIICIVFSIIDLKTKSTKKYILNGVFGIITNIVGGILVLCAPETEKPKVKTNVSFDEKQESEK